MPSTYTSNLGVEKPGTGEQDGVWGDTVNENMDIIDRAINGTVTLTLTGTASTLTTSDGVLSDGQYKLLVLGGTPSGTHTITIAPNDAQKIYFVRNTTAQSVVFTQGSGGNVTIATGDSGIIYANGGGGGAAVVNLTDHFAMSSVKITGGAITGATINNAVIGGTTPVAGTFTTLSGTTSLTSPLLSAGLGTAAAPSVTFTGDTNTGIYSPGADTFAVSTGGVERLRIDSAGDVGIGTNNPIRPLHIVTSGATNAAAYLQNDTGDATIFLRSQDTGAVSIQFGDTTAFNSGFLQYTNSTDLMTLRSTGAMTFQSGGATERARIHASGGVSIGNATDPGATNLSVTGAISTGDAATTRTNLGLTIGTNVQAYDAGLQSIAGLTTAADRMIYTTAADTYAVTTLTAAGRALLDDADAAAQRTTLGLGTLATQSGTFSGTSSGTNTGDQNIFQNIAVAGQTTVVADSTADTLTLAAGSGVTITTNATTDTITIAATGSGGTVTSVAVSGGTTGLTTSGGPITGSGTITLAGTLALANGGTGATTAANARTNLGAQATITGAATTITSSNLTASRALASDGSGKVAVSATTATELGYVSGVTSAIQTQINTKAPSASPSLSGTITITGGTQNWTVVASGTNLTFAYNGVNVMRLSSAGDLTVIGNVTAYGTIA